jgi:uncharacterized protein (TIGR02145 family)
MTKDKSKSLSIHQNNSLARVERSIALTNKLLSTIDETVTDIDGNVYKTVKIGDQTWMAENLKVTHYRNGDPIPTGFSDEEWASLNVGAYCFYDDDPSNLKVYGNLYNWYAIEDDRGVCPDGFHVPSNKEWMELVRHLGLTFEFDDFGDIGTDQGSQLAGNADLWNSGCLKKTSVFGSSGFNALPGGYRGFCGSYSTIGSFGLFWSSTASFSSVAWLYTFNCNDLSVGKSSEYMRSGYSIRCVKD